MDVISDNESECFQVSNIIFGPRNTILERTAGYSLQWSNQHRYCQSSYVIQCKEDSWGTWRPKMEVIVFRFNISIRTKKYNFRKDSWIFPLQQSNQHRYRQYSYV